MHATAVVKLPRPPEEVFDLFADIRNEERWHPDYRGATLVGDGPIGAGTAFDARYRGFGRLLVEITEYDRPNHLRFRGVGRGIEMDAAFAFVPQNGGTVLELDVEGQLRGALRLLGPIVGPMFRREMAKRPRQIEAAFPT